jgi:adenylate cyclase
VGVATLHILPDDRDVEIRKGQTILQASLKAGVPHTHACGGNARCTTCRVVVVDGVVGCSEPTWRESRVVRKLGFGSSFRLACQTRVDGDVTIRRLVLDPSDVALTDARDRPVPVGEERDVAVLFCDIRSFTPLAEQLLPYDVIHLLNRFHFDMTQAINQCGGIVTTYMGDGLMALFGARAPDPLRSPSWQAVSAGLAMLARLDQRKPEVEAIYGTSFDIGIGVHAGPAVVGHLGGDARILTAIGDVVNVASRIEGANKVVGSRLLVSQEVCADVGDQAVFGRRVELELKGKSGTFSLSEVTGLRA